MQIYSDGNFCAANDGRGLCESLCTSDSNGYTCSCLDGFAINEDLHNCDGKNKQKTNLLFKALDTFVNYSK